MNFPEKVGVEGVWLDGRLEGGSSLFPQIFPNVSSNLVLFFGGLLISTLGKNAAQNSFF